MPKIFGPLTPPAPASGGHRNLLARPGSRLLALRQRHRAQQESRQLLRVGFALRLRLRCLRCAMLRARIAWLVLRLPRLFRRGLLLLRRGCCRVLHRLVPLARTALVAAGRTPAAAAITGLMLALRLFANRIRKTFQMM